MDFVHDQLATVRRLRILTVADKFERYAPAVDARFNHQPKHVVAALGSVYAEPGTPGTIRIDQGSEFVSREVAL